MWLSASIKRYNVSEQRSETGLEKGQRRGRGSRGGNVVARAEGQQLRGKERPECDGWCEEAKRVAVDR